MDAVWAWFIAPCYWAIGVAKRSIAKEFTRESINIQKALAAKIASEFKTDVYVFDKTGFFCGADNKTFNDVRYLLKDGRYGVLSGAAQKIMKSSNEYLQFNTNKDNVGKDSIGVKYLLTAVFEDSIREYKLRIAGGQERANLVEAVRELKKILKEYEAIEKTTSIEPNKGLLNNLRTTIKDLGPTGRP